MSAPYDHNEQELERLLRDLYDTTYEASTLPTPASVWAGVAPRLLHATQSENTHNHAHPNVPALAEQAIASDAGSSADSTTAAPRQTSQGGDAERTPSTIPMQPMQPMKLIKPTPDSPLSPTLTPRATPNRERATPAWRGSPRLWMLPRMAAPLVAAAVIVSLLVGVFVALGFRHGVSTQAATPHPCLQHAPTTTSGVMALALNSGDTVLLRASDGKQLWRVHTGFPTNTPVIVGNVVYVLSRDNEISARRLDDGSQIWNVVAPPAGSGPFGSAQFIVDCGVVLVNTANGGMVAYRASDGAHLWTYQDYAAPSPAPGVAFPYLGVPTVLAAGDGIVYVESERLSEGALQKSLVWTVKALRETDGRLLWQARPNQPDGEFLAANLKPGYFFAGPQPFTAVTLPGALYLINVSSRPSLMVYAEQSGALLHRVALTTGIGINGALIVAGSRLYLERIDRICRLTPNDGSLSACYQTSAIGLPYLVATADALYIPVAGQADPSVTITAIRATDGSRLWSWDVPRIGSFFPTLVFQGSVATAGVVGVVTSVAIYGVRASDGYRLWSWSPPGAFTHPDTDTYTITGATAG